MLAAAEICPRASISPEVAHSAQTRSFPVKNKIRGTTFFLWHLMRSTASYATYINKYLEAFKMCSREGAPRYSTMRLGYLEPHKIYNVGQCLLLLAAIFAFMWSNVIGFYIEHCKATALTNMVQPGADATSFNPQAADHLAETTLERERWKRW